MWRKALWQKIGWKLITDRPKKNWKHWCDHYYGLNLNIVELRYMACQFAKKNLAKYPPNYDANRTSEYATAILSSGYLKYGWNGFPDDEDLKKYIVVMHEKSNPNYVSRTLKHCNCDSSGQCWGVNCILSFFPKIWSLRSWNKMNRQWIWWMQQGNFVKYMDFFINTTIALKQSPKLLLLRRYINVRQVSGLV